MPRPITNAEMRRRQLVNLASQAITQAMLDFTEQHGELTPLEWLRAFRTCEDRVITEGLAGEWSDSAPGN